MKFVLSVKHIFFFYLRVTYVYILNLQYLLKYDDDNTKNKSLFVSQLTQLDYYSS